MSEEKKETYGNREEFAGRDPIECPPLEAVDPNAGIGPQQSLFPDELSEGERRSPRWHMKGENGRVFIMYGEEVEVRARALAAGYSDVEPSGYYTTRGNRIVSALDGPTSYVEGRKAPGH